MKVEVRESPGARFGFDQAAIRAVRPWRYKPALQDGKPVDVYLQVRIRFLLES